MDTDGLPTIESTPDIAPDQVGATLLAAHVLGEEPSNPTPATGSSAGSTSPSGWALVMASVAIALAVLLILGIGLGIGYILDMRSGVDSFGVQSDAGSCTTST